MSTAEIGGIRSRFGKWMQDSSNRAKVLLVPLLVFELVFFIAPALILLRFSLLQPTGQQAYVSGTWSLDAYNTILNSSVIHKVLFFTVEMSVYATVLTLLLSILLSYAIWRTDGIVKVVLLLSVLLPLFTTLVVKIYAMAIILAPVGLVNSLLLDIGVLNSPIRIINNKWGVLLGQIYITMPYATLAIYSVLPTIEWNTVEAARDLGASRPRSVIEVVLPQALPGIVVGTVIIWTWSMGAYTAPALLGSGSEWTVALEIQNVMLTQFNWPVGAALAIVLLVIILISILLITGMLNRLGGDVDV
jgi:spermidine/putrescine transport system permease protein